MAQKGLHLVQNYSHYQNTTERGCGVQFHQVGHRAAVLKLFTLWAKTTAPSQKNNYISDKHHSEPSLKKQ